MKWEILKNEIIYGEIKGFTYIINPKTAYVHTHNWYGCELGRIAVRYKTKHGKWRRRHIDESFFRHDEIDVNGKTMDLIEFIKSESAKKKNYKRIEVECVDRPEQTISYEPDYKYYEK